ncbi:hypothetical protein FOZ62_023552 [Perkinsus olseni]|uniref:Uncharacterized protein n=1 Tax=Perkinsus olseni TaxID=32597 RepID=A0A7J6S4D1_PEROL|nr:hypothetical protein FOZ62_023552 [Perkinsus olseni]
MAEEGISPDGDAAVPVERAAEAGEEASVDSPPQRRVLRRVIDVEIQDPRRLPYKGRPRDKSYKPYYRSKDRRQYRQSKIAARKRSTSRLKDLREEVRAEKRKRAAQE